MALDEKTRVHHDLVCLRLRHRIPMGSDVDEIRFAADDLVQGGFLGSCLGLLRVDHFARRLDGCALLSGVARSSPRHAPTGTAATFELIDHHPMAAAW
jgi:hypothetical protein